MRRTALALAVLAASASAFGGDPPPRPTGTTLLDALPPQADVVVETPDLPALLEAECKSGLGDASAWRAAFDAQLRAWGAGAADPTKLSKGGLALLDAADGEALVASFDMKLPSRSGPSVRAALFAMRSTQTEKTLHAAFTDLLDGGLRQAYEGEPHLDRIAGRPVAMLPGNGASLFVLVQDGLVVATDHELAMGLFIAGLSKSAAAPPAGRPDAGRMKLFARHGTGDAAWEGWTWGEAESVTWRTDKRLAPFRVPSTSVESRAFVVLVGADRFGDVPVLPTPLSRPDLARHAGVNAVGFMDDGDACVLDVEHLMGAARLSEGGGASRLAWLRAYRTGKIDLPVPGVDRALLAGPYESAAKTAGAAVGEFVAWKAADEPGKILGPIGHGPATFLALRCLHDALRHIAPGGAAPPPAPPERPKVPLPPPTAPQDH